MTLHNILKHDLLSTCPLFVGDLPAEATKSKLMSEITLDSGQWNRESNEVTHVVVDFMSKIRQLPINQYSTFGEVINCLINSASNVCQGIKFVHIVLDSYVEFS